MSEMSDNTIHVCIEKISDGYIGKCVEFSNVIVWAKTPEGISKEITKAVTGYLKAFPDEIKILTKKQDLVQAIPIEC